MAMKSRLMAIAILLACSGCAASASIKVFDWGNRPEPPVVVVQPAAPSPTPTPKPVATPEVKS